MHRDLTCDEDLLRSLPLPLAQLCRQAHNAKSPLDRHQSAYFLWEAALKLLGSAAVVHYAEHPHPDAQLAERLQNLARPALGHWWEFVRLLVPVLADAGDPGFQAVRDLLLGRTRDDLPLVAGLDATLREALDGTRGARTTVRLSELFDRLVRYRNQELGHGAAGQRGGDFYERMGRALLAGIPELLGRLNVLAGRQLVYVAEVRRQSSGGWLVERYELAGEAPRKLETLELAESESGRLPRPEQVYLQGRAAPGLVALHPLAVYDPETAEVLLLNARRGRQRSEYLGYKSGRVVERPDCGGEQRALLARVLNVPVDDGQLAQWAARSQAEEGPTTPADRPPTRCVGEFELLTRLGQGGMGVVYRAWQPSLGRQVALKCLLRTGDKAEARFAREIKALGRVEHPSLVKVFTSGAEGDQWFYAMELLEGATLAAVCDKLQARTAGATQVDPKTWQETLSTACEEARKAEQPLGDPGEALPWRPLAETVTSPAVAGRSHVEQVVELVRQVAEAAHALHEANVIHRDIKPGNIMVSPDGGQAVLMDLGLAQLADEQDGRLTRTRQFVGTLRYASPEQLGGATLDRRADVYSLGATLWELLTLRPLFGVTEETPTPDLIFKMQQAEPERPRKYNQAVPRDLEAVVLKCLEKDPARRYATARELADDLGRWLRGEPVRARPLTWNYVLGKWLRRRRRPVALAAGLVLLQAALVAGLVGFLSRGGRAPERPGGPPSVTPEGNDARIGELPPAGKRRALLVGVTRIESVPSNQWLEAPRYDVALMQALLKQDYHFSDDDITVLAEGVGGKDRRPTRENIAREIQRLADLAERGDQVLIYLSGEGGGSLFVPADWLGFNRENDWLANAITGREFALWIKPISERGASLWVICDGGNGGSGSELDFPAGVTFLYAAQPHESTVEKMLDPLVPYEGPERHPHGLFTYTLCRVLSRDPGQTSAALIERVRAQYLAQGRSYPLPWAVGPGRGRLFLGSEERPGLARLRVYQHAQGSMHLNAGSLAGLTPGMILGVYWQTAQGRDGPLVGHVRITALTDEDARVQPCPYAGLAAPTQLPDRNHCELVFIDYGDQRLTLGLDPHTASDEWIPDVDRERLTKELQQLVKEDVPLARWAGDAEQVQVRVQLDSTKSGRLYLMPGSQQGTGGKAAGGQKRVIHPLFGPLPEDRNELQSSLRRFTRASNLLNLTERLAAAQVANEAALDVDLKLIQYSNEEDQQGRVDPRDRGLTLTPGKSIAFQVTNYSQAPIDVTLLQINPDYTITPLFTRWAEGSAQKPFVSPRLRLSEESEGSMHMVMIAVKRNGPPADFSFLAEPTLEKARERVPPGTPEQTIDSELGRFLRTALYADGDVHGLDVNTINSHALRKVSWEVTSQREAR